jgi:hypothetical protein
MEFDYPRLGLTAVGLTPAVSLVTASTMCSHSV